MALMTKRPGRDLTIQGTARSVFEYEGVNYTEIGLQLPADLPLPMWESALSILGRIKSGIEFALGDVINFYGKHYGSTYENAQEVTNLAKSTLEGYALVASSIPFEHRVPGVEFCKHEAVAALYKQAPDVAREILERAAEEHLTLREVRFDVRTARADLNLPEPVADYSIGITHHEGRSQISGRTALYHAPDSVDVPRPSPIIMFPSAMHPSHFEETWGQGNSDGVVEITPSVDWLPDLFSLVVAAAQSEPKSTELEDARRKCLLWLSAHEIPVEYLESVPIL